MGQYIPDLTERFPEGFGGVDMTPSYFGEPVDWRRAYKEDDYDAYYEELEALERKEISLFKIDHEYENIGIFGGITIYKAKSIDREAGQILLAEAWRDVDGEGTRPAKWHKLEIDEYGNERVLLWTSKTYGDIWLYAE